MTKTAAARKKGRMSIASRLGVPVLFMIGIFVGEKAFQPAGLLRTYLDAGFFFFAGLFLVRFFDVLILAWYAHQEKPFPLPVLLHSLVLAVFNIVILFAILKNVLHVNLTPYLATSAVLTMVVGLAFQGVMGNVFSGMSLHFTKTLGRGDWVAIGTHEGVVLDTNWRETRILDRNSNIVIIPNAVIATERIINYSRPDHRTALHFSFKISASAPAGEVLEALLESARDCTHVLKEPSPKAYLASYDETGLSYILKFWIEDFGLKDIILTEVGRLAWYKLRRRGIQVAVSWTDRVRELADAIGAARPAGGILDQAQGRLEDTSAVERTAAVLLASSFLRDQEGEGRLMVGDEDLHSLATRVHRSIYAKGEVLCRQGEKGTSCYVVGRGRVHGQIVYEEGGKKFVTEFAVGPGGIFGEMSLFTGLPRTATGIVTEESELVKIEAHDFAVLLEHNAELAEVIAEMVTARNAQNKEFLKKIKELSEKDIEHGTNKKSVLEYLKNFVRSLKK
jgi:small-conductance mechanosensitive channel/CRP-like cAMP-binding protein